MKKLNWPGIDPGDTVLIHSSLSRTCKTHNVTPTEVLESFIDAVGPGGTLIFPVFNFDFCHGKPFHFKETLSKMGVLSEIARNWPGAIRTGHPISGYVGIGTHAEMFCGVNNKMAYVQDSPLVTLYGSNSKIAILDLNAQAAITFYHYVEQTHGVDWRFSKEFTGRYTDQDGKTTDRTYELYVKHGWGATNADPMDEILWGMGLYAGDRRGVDSGLRVIQAEPLFDALTFVMKNLPDGGEGLIWRRTEKQDQPQASIKARSALVPISATLGENDEAWSKKYNEQ